MILEQLAVTLYDIATGTTVFPTPVSIGPDMSVAQAFHIAPEPGIDPLANLNWAPGEWAKTHSLAASVLHKSQPIATDGHDLGPLLQHLGPGLITSIGSSRRVAFTASTVLMCKKATAAIDLKRGFVMLACGEVTMVGTNVSNTSHSVKVGVTLLDIALGAIDVAVTVTVDLVMEAIGANEMMKITPEGYAQKATGLDPSDALKSSVTTLLKTTAQSWASGWEKPIQVPVSFGRVPTFGMEWSYDPSKKQLSETASVKALGRGEEVAVYHDPHGFHAGAKTTGLEHDKSWGEPL